MDMGGEEAWKDEDEFEQVPLSSGSKKAWTYPSLIETVPVSGPPREWVITSDREKLWFFRRVFI
jgi:hypothetical protein